VRCTARNANARSVSLLRSNADRIEGEWTSSRTRVTVAASGRLYAGGRFCDSKLRATLMASTIARSELMRKKAPGTLAFQLDILPTRFRVQMPALAGTLTGDYMQAMCGRVIQSSGPLRYAIVDGMNVRDSRVHNYPPRWNAAPKQELLVIRRNHQTGEVSLDPLRWGLIPYWCKDPTGGRKPINATCETVRGLPTFRDAYRRRRCIVPVDGLLRVEGDQGAEGEAALRDCHEGRHAVRHRSQEAYGLGLKSKMVTDFSVSPMAFDIRCDGPKMACDAFEKHVTWLIE
jgi:hypothetical protein